MKFSWDSPFQICRVFQRMQISGIVKRIISKRALVDRQNRAHHRPNQCQKVSGMMLWKAAKYESQIFRDVRAPLQSRLKFFVDTHGRLCRIVRAFQKCYQNRFLDYFSCIFGGFLSCVCPAEIQNRLRADYMIPHYPMITATRSGDTPTHPQGMPTTSVGSTVCLVFLVMFCPASVLQKSKSA